MRKKNIFILVFVLILVIAISIFITILFQKNFFSNSYELIIGEKKINIKIPKYSYVVSDENSNLKFKSLSNTNQINNVKNEYLSNLRENYCSIDGTTYYFDNKSGMSIYNYQVHDGSLLNEFSFDYYYGNYCNDLEMKKVQEELNTLNFEIRVISIPDSNCDNKKLNKLYSNSSYDIYYTNCLSDIYFKQNDIERKLIEELQVNSEIINKMLRRLEIGSKYAEGSKNVYEDGSTLYSNYHYKLLVCPSVNNKTKYIIGNTFFEHYESVCES